MMVRPPRELFVVPALLILALSALRCSPPGDTPPPYGPTPSAEQLGWHRMEMNAFIHFGINTFTNKEWGYGDESPERFNPTEFDAGQWVSLFAEVGFKGLILTVKHHDGFCLWPSQHTGHSVANSPWKNGKGDVVREVAEACRTHGLKFGIYLSPWDRNHPDYGTEAYVAYYRTQLDELFTEYGPVFEIWFDGANGGDGFYGGSRMMRRIDGSTYYDWPETIMRVRAREPGVLLFSDAGPDIRWCGNERGEGGLLNWNLITPDTLYPGKPAIYDLLNTGSQDGASWIPAEVNTSIRPGWFYHPEEDSLVKTPEQLFHLYLASVGRGSTLLLNVPPDPRGLIHEHDAASLRGWRRLLDERFRTDLALGAEVEVSSEHGASGSFGGNHLTDGDPETYWAAADSDTLRTITIRMTGPASIRYVLLQEQIALGQRVSSFVIEAMVDESWSEIGQGTTIGYKRIIKVVPIVTDRVRVRILDSRAAPVVSAVSVF